MTVSGSCRSCFRIHTLREGRGLFSEAPGRRHVENVFISENECDIAFFIMHQNTVIGVPGKVLERFFIKNSKIVSFEKERIFLFSSSLSADTAHI